MKSHAKMLLIKIFDVVKLKRKDRNNPAGKNRTTQRRVANSKTIQSETEYEWTRGKVPTTHDIIGNDFQLYFNGFDLMTFNQPKFKLFIHIKAFMFMLVPQSQLNYAIGQSFVFLLFQFVCVCVSLSVH